MRAIVTGAAGQDGTLLRAALEARGIEVLAIDRPRKMANGFAQISLTDEDAVRRMFLEFRPDRLYHLAAAHHSSEQTVGVDFEREMIDTNFRAIEVFLSTIHACRPECRILLAGTSHMYSAPAGETRTIDESTPMSPMSFYGLTKAWSRELLTHFRDRWGVYGSTAILFNHESTLRPSEFVTRKVTLAAARASRGDDTALELLDLHSATDWCSAADVVEGMYLALEPESPVDYVLASGRTHSVTDLLDVAFGTVGLDWRHSVRETGGASRRGTLVGDPSRARALLGWNPKVDFEALIREMVQHDVALLGS